jgi:hypothetical protein
MKRFMLTSTICLLAACGVTSVAPPPAAHRILPSAPPAPGTGIDRIRETTEQDLLWSATQRFGEPLARRALAAPIYIFAKHYQGMLPPPPPGAGPDWKYPEPPAAIVIQENGRWLAATPDGFREARPDKAGEIEQILSDRAFWDEPTWAPPGCTDAGASLLLVKARGKPETVRSATCGTTGRSELLVFRTLEA